VIQVRDSLNHFPLPGIDIGDCGDKIGIQGVDNGWMTFNNFYIPKSALLNRFGDVDKDGIYSSPVESKSK
jgi:acyl-CoA oxidase